MTGNEKRHLLELALERAGPTHRVEDVIARIKDGRAQLWDRGDGCIITEINDYPLRKVVNYWLIAGVLQECLALEPDINAWARSEGCTVATGSGRRGWGRVSPGWKPWPTWVKSLEGEP